MSEIPQHEGDKAQQELLLKRGGQLVDNLLNNVMPVPSSKTTRDFKLVCAEKQAHLQSREAVKRRKKRDM
ncbi:MAG: hypothetical protein II899_12100 [Bacteroidales bacterium]|nr:hypothetical protein [Bacteroidales bacterium]